MAEQDERMVRLGRLIATLEQVSKQAADLGRMAVELHEEAQVSMRLATGTSVRGIAANHSGRKRKAQRKKQQKRR